MGLEIERKFLVRGTGWKKNVPGTRYRQGYLTLDHGRTVRVRTDGEYGFLTVKGKSRGISCREFEYLIPYADALAMLENMCLQPVIEKIRYRVEYEGFIWTIDEFLGENFGLVMAELELEYEEQPFSLPPWVTREVSGDARYYNASLVQNPWNTWHE